LLSGTPRTNFNNHVVGIIFVGQDITELTLYRKSLERKVEEKTQALKQALLKEKEALDLKSRFVSVASHEFKTPLSSIQHAAQFLTQNKNHLKPSVIIKKLQIIDQQTVHMFNLLNDILTIGKTESHKIVLSLTEIPLQSFIKSLVEEVKVSTKGSHAIKIDIRDGPKNLVSDEKLLRNILINLLTNAIKYSPGRKHISLYIHSTASQLHISVRDEGIGIAQEDLDKIFEPFIRGSKVSMIPGTGLGLSIVKKAVELLQGSITVDSKVQSGSVFTVVIPFLNEEPNDR